MKYSKIAVKKILVILCAATVIVIYKCQVSKSNNTSVKSNKITNLKTSAKMQVEIWSDVMCPFCYIGKRKFEAALSQFADSAAIQVVWKSYQLNPDMKTDTTKNSIAALAEHKGISLQESEEMHKYVIEMAEKSGLNYNMKNTISANSFNAHRLTHFAKSMGKQLALEEKLFEAYFVLGKNIDDINTLISIGTSVGLLHDDLVKTLQSDAFAEDVREDIYEAQQVGVRGVPFFVFDRKFAVSGAQESNVFLTSLEKSFAEWKKANPNAILNIVDGKVCEPNKDCK